MPLRYWLYSIIFIDGYVVLATELLLIRQLIPFVGNGTETISIAISAVLLPLAVGYYAGGRFHIDAVQHGVDISVRKKLLRNILIATLFLVMGLSYVVMNYVFDWFISAGIRHYVVQAAIYCMLFIVYPIYLLGQTIPLVTNYFTESDLSEITGKVLFFSTAGSFLGSIFSTLILMSTIGVHNTVIVTILLLTTLVGLISRRLMNPATVTAVILAAVTFFLNNDSMMKRYDIVSNNAYNTVKVYDYNRANKNEDTKMLSVNHAFSAIYSPTTKQVSKYIQFIHDNLIVHMKKKQPMSVLVIGAGGFTLGHDDKFNDYTYVDVDGALKDVAEEHFLHRKLNPNQEFIAEPARAFLNNYKEKYDFIFLDAFTNVHNTPYQLITREFLQQVRDALQPGGAVVSNIIDYGDFSDQFTIKYDNTFRAVFPHFNRIPMSGFDPWGKPDLNNVLYFYFDRDFKTSFGSEYTDDRNSYFWDKDYNF